MFTQRLVLVQFVGGPQEDPVGAAPRRVVGSAFHGLDLVGGDPALLGDQHVLAPLVRTMAVPAGAQDQQLALAGIEGVLREHVGGEHQPAFQHVGVVPEHSEDVQRIARRTRDALGQQVVEASVLALTARRQSFVHDATVDFEPTVVSCASNHFFDSMPGPNPVSEPSAPITR